MYQAISRVRRASGRDERGGWGRDPTNARRMRLRSPDSMVCGSEHRIAKGWRSHLVSSSARRSPHPPLVILDTLHHILYFKRSIHVNAWFEIINIRNYLHHEILSILHYASFYRSHPSQVRRPSAYPSILLIHILASRSPPSNTNH